ncbi:hypothetical protein TanjilG_08854 [Lupinus angustifolius]|uniref:Regulator of Vps4 activity in the MVB pathway protein n=1 Tax=Lupinus angustifolius TaxID=3871 RepID=A0A1J7IQZ2_LUPAN|nr:hypothetical protein TanjilG_08854 [Lupinus angustifolius]
MGLLGKRFTYKFNKISRVAFSRIAILKKQHKARCSYAKSDVVQFLNLGHHHHALLRVEQWIEEQNMLDVFVMIENCCNFLRERAQVLENNKECPCELKEVISSLIYASSRCGEFPELQKIRDIFTSKFGKEFADHAIELHKNNSVNSKLIQKLSRSPPTMEIRMKALQKIAAEIGVTLHFQQDEPILINENKPNDDQRLDELETRKYSNTDDIKHKENSQDGPENIKYERKSTALDVDPIVSSNSKPEDKVISKSNHLDLEELEMRVREITKQFAREESKSSQNPRDNIQASENTELECNAAAENEDLSEERNHPSYQARRQN